MYLPLFILFYFILLSFQETPITCVLYLSLSLSLLNASQILFLLVSLALCVVNFCFKFTLNCCNYIIFLLSFPLQLLILHFLYSIVSHVVILFKTKSQFLLISLKVPSSCLPRTVFIFQRKVFVCLFLLFFSWICLMNFARCR